MTWEAQPGPQYWLCHSPVFEVLFGGARGGGKTDAMLGEWAGHAQEYGTNAIGVMMRRHGTELEEAIERSQALYQGLGEYNLTKKSWRFANGARLKFRHLDNDADAQRYQGHSYTRVYFEELQNFPSPDPVLKMLATLRSGAGVPCCFRATANPGGPGHQWVKARYVDPAPLGRKIIEERFISPFTGVETVRERVFIPSKLTDNKFLGDDYVAQLQMQASPELVRAWLEGDWNQVVGAFFSEWNPALHVVRPFEVPKAWGRFRSFDWGSARPFACHWWAVSDGTIPAFPRGALICYREWYGASAPNVGLKMTAEAVGAGIAERERGDGPMLGVADPAIFAEDGGPSIAEMMRRGGVSFRPADNKRLPGWSQLRGRLTGMDGRPMIYFFSTCEAAIRTLPAIQHDPIRAEDLDTKAEDHCFTGDTLVTTSNGVHNLAGLIGKSGLVLSQDGRWHGFRSARLVKRDQEIVRLGFSDGSEVRCTPDHRFMTARGWVQAKDLEGQAILSLQGIGLKSLMASDTIAAGTTINARELDCIGRYGRRHAVKSLRASTSTISTTTAATIASQISNVFRRKSISEEGTERLLRRALWSTSKRQSRLRERGMVAPKVCGGINRTMSETLICFTRSSQSSATNAGWDSRQEKAGSVPTNASRHGGARRGPTTKPGFARYAGRNTRSIVTRGRSTVRGLAVASPAAENGLVCREVSLAGRADVYCITVPSTGNFALANGAIVSNCADSVRYGIMSRPWTPPDPAKRAGKTDKWDAAFNARPAENWKTA